MEDEAIIQLFWDRDQSAVSETEKRYGARLNRLSYGILKSREDAEESVNDTYLKAWNTIPPQRPVFFFAYLAKICRYLSFGRIDWKHAKKRNAEIVELTAEMESCIPDEKRALQIEGEEIGRLVSEFLRRLPEENRLLFLYRYWYADSIADISRRNGMSESNVKIRLYRVRNQLRSFLESEGIRI